MIVKHFTLRGIRANDNMTWQNSETMHLCKFGMGDNAAHISKTKYVNYLELVSSFAVMVLEMMAF